MRAGSNTPDFSARSADGPGFLDELDAGMRQRLVRASRDRVRVQCVLAVCIGVEAVTNSSLVMTSAGRNKPEPLITHLGMKLHTSFQAPQGPRLA